MKNSGKNKKIKKTTANKPINIKSSLMYGYRIKFFTEFFIAISN